METMKAIMIGLVRTNQLATVYFALKFLRNDAWDDIRLLWQLVIVYLQLIRRCRLQSRAQSQGTIVRIGMDVNIVTLLHEELHSQMVDDPTLYEHQGYEDTSRSLILSCVLIVVISERKNGWMKFMLIG